MWKNVILTHFEMNPVTMGMSFVSCFAFYNFFFHFEFFFFQFIPKQLHLWAALQFLKHSLVIQPQHKLGLLAPALVLWDKSLKNMKLSYQFLSALWSWNYHISLRDYPVNQANLNTIHPKRLVSIHCVSSHNCICLRRAPIIYCNLKSKHRELSLFLLVCN